MTEKRNNPPKPLNPPGERIARRQGGLKGGKARAEKLSPERRREIALNATRARWAKTSREKPAGQIACEAALARSKKKHSIITPQGGLSGNG